MSDAGWLAIALTAGAVFAALWVTRERWIHRRRARRRGLDGQ
jgi:hypothetical protein